MPTPGPITYDAYGAEQADIERQRRYAEALRKQTEEGSPQGQNVGGWFVAPSWTQHAAHLLRSYNVGAQEKSAQERQKALAERYQTDLGTTLTDYSRALQGTPGSVQDTTQEGTGSFDMSGTAGPANVAPAAPNPQLAAQILMRHPGTQAMGMAQIQKQAEDAARAQKLAQALGIQGGGQPAGGAGGQPAAQGGQMGALKGLPPQIVAMMTSGDPELVKLATTIIEANKGIAQRPGAPVVNPLTGEVIAQPTPAVPAGVGLQVGPGGPQAYPVPGANAAMAGAAAATAGGTAAGGAPYKLENVQTEGAPTLMTQQQAIEAASGRPMPIPGAAPAGQPMPQPGGGTPWAAQGPMKVSDMPPEQQAAARSLMGGAQGSVTFPAPGQQAPRGPGLRLQDQGAAAEQKEFGKALGEYTTKVQEAAASAAVGNRYLDNMELAAQDIRLGKLAPAQSTLIQWAQAAGIPVSEDAKKTAGSTQALTSMAIKMAGQATRQADAQPSQLQYLKMLESMPDQSRSADGFQKIVAYLRDTNNYAVAKHQELQKWRQTHNGTAEGFEAAWPKMAADIPFVWNKNRRADDLKAIVGSSSGADPLGLRSK